MRQFLRSLIDLSGTASRKRGWIIFGLWLVGTCGLFAAATVLPDLQRWVFLPIAIGQALLVSMLVQRLHDAGRSGVWALLGLAPLAGFLAMIVIMALRPAPIKQRGNPTAQKMGSAALLLLVAMGASRIIWTPYWIPAGSMTPTLLIGDYIIVTLPPFAGFQRGDVVVFRHPVGPVDLVKRLIGLPGDTVQMKDGLLYLNGALAVQVADGEFTEVFEKQGPMQSLPLCSNNVASLGDACVNMRVQETLPNGVTHAALNISDGSPGDTTELITIPEGMYFFLGDHRDNSMDSRFSQTTGGPGLVPAANLIGRARWILFSSVGTEVFDRTSWREGRYFQAIE